MNKQFGKLRKDGSIIFAPDKITNSKGEVMDATEQILKVLGFVQVIDEKPEEAEGVSLRVKYEYVTEDNPLKKASRPQINVAIRAVYEKLNTASYNDNNLAVDLS